MIGTIGGGAGGSGGRLAARLASSIATLICWLWSVTGIASGGAVNCCAVLMKVFRSLTVL